MKVLTFSRHFPKGHPKAGQPTYFVEQILNSILPRPLSIGLNEFPPAARDYINDFMVIDGEHKKHHTIRGGSRWKPGDMASLRVWSGKPYQSKQVEFAQVEVKKVWSIEIVQNAEYWVFKLNGKTISWNDLDVDQFVEELAKNDGLTTADFLNWFSIHPKKKEQVFTGQIICWNHLIEY